MKNLLKNLGILLISTVLCGILLEGTVRAIFPTYNPSTMVKFYHNKDGVLLGEKSSTTRQWMKAGDFDIAVNINQYGFRDRKDLRESASEALFVVGDSFSFGHGVDENKRYSNLLEQMLRLPVYNISIPSDFEGYEKLIRYAQQQGALINHLIVGVCMENDLRQYLLEPSSSSNQVTDTAYYSGVDKNLFFQTKIFLGKTSATYNMLISLFHQNMLLKDIVVNLGIMDNPVEGINKAIYSETILESSWRRLKLLQENTHIPDMTVVLIPSRALWLGENRETESKVHRLFVQLLEQQKLDVVDLRPAFEEGGTPLQYHFEHDGHWNELGHRKAVEVIYQHLEERYQ